MRKRPGILKFILKPYRKIEGASTAYDEEAIGYEAFPSRYLDKIIKNYRYSMRFFEKAEKIKPY